MTFGGETDGRDVQNFRWGTLPVFAFDCEVSAQEVPAMIHRIDVRLFSRYTAGASIELRELPDE